MSQWGLGVPAPLDSRCRPHMCHHMGMDTSTTPHISSALETIEYGAVYRIRAPRTGEPWTLYKVSDDCGVSSIEPLDVPDCWDDSYEYVMADEGILPRLTRLAVEAYLAHAILEAAFVPVDDEEADADSRALLYRFSWPY